MSTYTPSMDAPVKEPALYGLLAEFHDPQSLMNAANVLRKTGYYRWDCYTPFPVHGLDKVMGQRPSVLPVVVFTVAALGCIGMLALAWYCNAFNYPIVVSGKPYWGLGPHMFLAFPVTVLASVTTTFYATFIFCKLPIFRHPLFTSERFRRATDDGFFIAVEARDAKFDLKVTSELLNSAGALAVEEVRD